MPRNLNQKAKIRLATIDDLAALCGMGQARHGPSCRSYIHTQENSNDEKTALDRVLDRCTLVVEEGEMTCGYSAIDLDRAAIGGMSISREARTPGLPEKLLARTEQLAVRFGLESLRLTPNPASASFFLSRGFVPASGEPHEAEAREYGCGMLHRSLRRRETAYGRLVRDLCAELKIPAGYGRLHRLPLQPEVTRMVSIGTDVFGREQFLGPRAARAWRLMQTAALEQGIELQAVSAWRSVDYQAGLLRRKLAKGLSIEEVLRASAAPGFSEHHTGRAIDITTPGYAVLEEDFENSAAFHWMERQAKEFGFRLSFPRENRHGLAFEPWHWFFDD